MKVSSIFSHFFSLRTQIFVSPAICTLTFLFNQRENQDASNPSRLPQRFIKQIKNWLTPNSISSKALDKNWVYKLPRNPEYIIDTDAGNDPDDVLALVFATQAFGNQIRLVTTTLFRPEEKARICKLILSEMGYPSIRVSSGYGAYKGEEDFWLEKYPCWPTKFGIPGKTNKVSLLQGLAYTKYFSNFNSHPILLNSASADISQICKIGRNNIVIIAQASLTNLAHAFENLQKVNRIVMMGGWFEDDNREILRLGYNTAVDLKASQQILEQNKVPLLIVSSQLIKKLQFVIKDKEREVFLNSNHKTLLGKAICDDMHNYWNNKIPAKGELCIADMLTAYIAKHPKVIAKSQPINITFSKDLLTIDMFHKDSKNVINFSRVEESNIHLIEDLHEPEKIRMELILSLVPLFYPGLDLQVAKTLLETEEYPSVIVQSFNDHIEFQIKNNKNSK